MHLQFQAAQQERSAADPTQQDAITQRLQYANVPAGTPLKRQAQSDNSDIDFWQRYRCYR